MLNEPMDEAALQELALTLANLPLSDFIEVFRLLSDIVGEGRTHLGNTGWYLGGGGPLQRLTLAVAMIDGEVTETGKLRNAQSHVELVAYPTEESRYALPKEDEQGPTWGLWESGECPTCHAELCSQVKTALCPVCFTESALT